MKYINSNLITLKCVLFLFFGGIGSLLPFLPLHMNAVGLSKYESIVVSVVAPLIAIIGPLIAAPLADRLAGGFGGASRSKTGKYLRVMIAVCLVLATILYWLLLAIPPIMRSPPNVTFGCNENGGYILQDRCGAERSCYNWGNSKGSVLVKNCKYACNVTTTFTNEPATIRTENASDYSNGNPGENDYNFVGDISDIIETPAVQPEVIESKHPHMCFQNSTNPKESSHVCEVYTEFSKPIDFRIALKPSMENNDTDDLESCKYPLAQSFHCRIPHKIAQDLLEKTPDCVPMVACEIHDPYNNTNSLLRVSQCGYNNISFYLYLLIRCIADIFPAAAVALLGTAVVIATRETSTGRGDVGKQFAAGALGFAIFAPIIGGAAEGELLAGIICFTVLMLLATVILLFDDNMPLSPPEWWWHTRCGLLALPMSSVRKYGVETIALGVVLFLLGVFWNAIDTFLPWHVVKLEDGTALLIGLTITIGALPGVIYLFFAEKIVDYCGHSNILILCFVSYIIHHIALILITNATWLLICEFLEVFTLHLMWVTAILYLRHLVPRKFTACGQALPVIAHFCLGRCIGALIGGTAYSEYPDNFPTVHKWFTVAAAIFAIIYFVLYHFYLKVYCVAPTQLPPYPAPSVVQGANGNGSYTPLRVYHNSSAKKGHFRY